MSALSHEEYMKIAIEEARKGIHEGHGGPFGAVVVDKDGKVVGRGHNQVLKNQDPTCHGEVMAIRDACKNLGTFDLSGCRIYTTGDPCPMCMGAILWANIEEIFYGCTVEDTNLIGFRDGKFYELSKPENRVKFVHEVSRKQCLELYREYLKLSGGANY